MQRRERYCPFSVYFTTLQPALCELLEAVGDLPLKVLLYADSLKALQGSQYPDRCHPLALELYKNCHSVFMRVREIGKSYCYLPRVCLSFRMEQLGSHWAEFREIWYWSVFFPSKICQRIQLSLQSDSDNGHFTWTPVCICYNISLSSSWNEECVRLKL